MDELNDKLNRSGIRASVHSHTEYSMLVDQVVRARSAGIRYNVVIIGHSLGANDSLRMADELGDYKIPVSLVITYDPTASLPVPPNVHRVINFFSSANGWGAPLTRASGFRGTLSNVDLSNDPSMGHTEIDKSPRLHNRSIAYIRGAVVVEGDDFDPKAAAARAARSRPEDAKTAARTEAAKKAVEIPPTETEGKADASAAAATASAPAAAPQSAPTQRLEPPAVTGAPAEGAGSGAPGSTGAPAVQESSVPAPAAVSAAPKTDTPPVTARREN
jgi:hypothetical protein